MRFDFPHKGTDRNYETKNYLLIIYLKDIFGLSFNNIIDQIKSL